MGRILFSVILLVLLTVLIVMNLGSTATVNLFGAKFQNAPVIAVALISFALGVLYSLALYIGQYFHRTSRARLAKRHQDVEERERKLDVAEKPAPVQPEGSTETPERQPSRISKFCRKLF
jgi:uncharacterized integral membrane protein